MTSKSGSGGSVRTGISIWHPGATSGSVSAIIYAWMKLAIALQININPTHLTTL